MNGKDDITPLNLAKWPLKSEFVLGGMFTECGAKYWMQLGVRTERRAVSEKVEKASTKACAVLILAAEELSASNVVIVFEVL
jgi:hypothetical protein